MSFSTENNLITTLPPEILRIYDEGSSYPINEAKSIDNNKTTNINVFTPGPGFSYTLDLRIDLGTIAYISQAFLEFDVHNNEGVNSSLAMVVNTMSGSLDGLSPTIPILGYGDLSKSIAPWAPIVGAEEEDKHYTSFRFFGLKKIRFLHVSITVNHLDPEDMTSALREIRIYQREVDLIEEDNKLDPDTKFLLADEGSSGTDLGGGTIFDPDKLLDQDEGTTAYESTIDGQQFKCMLDMGGQNILPAGYGQRFRINKLYFLVEQDELIGSFGFETIQTSISAYAWKTVENISIKGNTEGSNIIIVSFDPVNARYIRMYSNPFSYGIGGTFKLFGMGIMASEIETDFVRRVDILEKYNLYYSARAVSEQSKIGVATSEQSIVESRLGDTDYEKYSGNPVIVGSGQPNDISGIIYKTATQFMAVRVEHLDGGSGGLTVTTPVDRKVIVDFGGDAPTNQQVADAVTAYVPAAAFVTVSVTPGTETDPATIDIIVITGGMTELMEDGGMGYMQVDEDGGVHIDHINVGTEGTIKVTIPDYKHVIVNARGKSPLPTNTEIAAAISAHTPEGRDKGLASDYVNMSIVPDTESDTMNFGWVAVNGFDEAGCEDPSIMKVDDLFYLYYVGENPNDGRKRIGLAVSEDGFSFKKMRGFERKGSVIDTGDLGRFESNSIINPTVSYDKQTSLEGLRIKIWYTGIDVLYNEQVGYATSSDGIRFVKRTPLFPVVKPSFRSFTFPDSFGPPGSTLQQSEKDFDRMTLRPSVIKLNVHDGIYFDTQDSLNGNYVVTNVNQGPAPDGLIGPSRTLNNSNLAAVSPAYPTTQYTATIYNPPYDEETESSISPIGVYHSGLNLYSDSIDSYNGSSGAISFTAPSKRKPLPPPSTSYEYYYWHTTPGDIYVMYPIDTPGDIFIMMYAGGNESNFKAVGIAASVNGRYWEKLTDRAWQWVTGESKTDRVLGDDTFKYDYADIRPVLTCNSNAKLSNLPNNSLTIDAPPASPKANPYFFNTETSKVENGLAEGSRFDSNQNIVSCSLWFVDRIPRCLYVTENGQVGMAVRVNEDTPFIVHPEWVRVIGTKQNGAILVPGDGAAWDGNKINKVSLGIRRVPRPDVVREAIDVGKMLNNHIGEPVQVYFINRHNVKVTNIRASIIVDGLQEADDFAYIARDIGGTNDTWSRDTDYLIHTGSIDPGEAIPFWVMMSPEGATQFGRQTFELKFKSEFMISVYENE